MICPHCGEDKRPGAGFARHVRVCERRPDRETLERWVGDGESAYRIARRLDGVSVTTVRRWLKKEKIARRPDAYERSLVRGMAPLYGEYRACRKCEMAGVCRERDRAGLWALCEMPEVVDVEQAVWEGLVELGEALEGGLVLRQAQDEGGSAFVDCDSVAVSADAVGAQCGEVDPTGVITSAGLVPV